AVRLALSVSQQRRNTACPLLRSSPAWSLPALTTSLIWKRNSTARSARFFSKPFKGKAGSTLLAKRFGTVRALSLHNTTRCSLPMKSSAGSDAQAGTSLTRDFHRLRISPRWRSRLLQAFLLAQLLPLKRLHLASFPA